MSISINGFDGSVTLTRVAAAPTVKRIVPLVQAKGYEGRFGATSLTIKNRSGATIYVARRTDVDNTTGREILDGDSYTWPPPGVGTIDMYKLHVYFTADGDIDIDFNTR